jgi:hypothetical protein
VGTWQRRAKQRMIELYGTKVQFRGGGGETNVFRADGTVRVVWNSTLSATHGGARWRDVTKGTVEAYYQASNGRVIYSRPVAKGTWRLERNGRRNNGGKLSLNLEPETYVCTASTLTLASTDYSIELVRLVPKPRPRPSPTATPSPAAAG